MPIRLDGKVAIVTGAGSGIGACAALALAKRGAKIVVNDAALDGRAERVAAQIVGAGGCALANTVAVGKFEAAKSIAAFAEDHFGGGDILINNAGIARPGPFWARDDAEIAEVLDVNLKGPFAMMRAVWPLMARKRSGRIVNMSSSAAFGSGVSGPYAASKAGLIGLTKDAAIAGKPHGVLVNCIMPSAYTPLLQNHPDTAFRAWMRENMSADFVAKVICWLANDENKTTGAIYGVAGGLVSRVGFYEKMIDFDRSLEPEGFSLPPDTGATIDDGVLIETQADHERFVAGFFPEE